MTIQVPDIQWAAVAPELALIVTAFIVLFLDFAVSRAGKAALGYVTALGMALPFAVMVLGITGKAAAVPWLAALTVSNGATAFSGMLATDAFAQFFTVLILGIGILVTLMSISALKEENLDDAGYHALVLLATVGMLLMVKGMDLVVIFLGLETLSIAIYVLAGYRKQSIRSTESGFKYFLLGAFAAGFLLYGIALLFGATGTTKIAGIARHLEMQGLLGDPLVLIGMVLILVGLGFKLALVPFHAWTPDVYEGAPSAITAFMAVGVKAASIAAFVRIFGGALLALEMQWKDVFWIMAVLTMTLGNVVALSQTNIKRMLAYSSIAHAGYMMVGIIAGGETGWSAVLFYMIAYAFMNLGAFGIIVLYGRKEEAHVDIADYAGMGFRYPLLGAAMAIFMFSLAGLPPLAGFVGKFYIFSAAIKAGYIWLTVIGVLNSLISVFYYFRVTVAMYMKEPVVEASLHVSIPIALVLISTAIGTVHMGVSPTIYLSWALNSIQWLKF